MNKARQETLVRLGALRHAAGTIDDALSVLVRKEGRTLLGKDGAELCTISRGDLSPHETDIFVKYLQFLLNNMPHRELP